MIIKVSEIPLRGRIVKFELDSASLESRLDIPDSKIQFKVEKAAVAEGVAHFASGNVTLSLSYNVELRTICSRCLDSTVFPLSEAFEMVFKDGSSEAEQVPDVGLDFFFDDKLSCEEVVQEQIAINLPSNPTCELSGVKCPEIKTSWGEAAETQSLSGLLKKAGIT